jgi:predicted O-linked N-acetylglucosamine transferase (SPINDLY family)
MAKKKAQVPDLLLKGMDAHRAGNLADAERFYRAALARHPALADGWHKLGILHLQKNETDKAIQALQQCVQRNTRTAPYLSDLGVALKRANRLDEALATYDRAIALQPDYAQAHNNRANILRELGRNAEAQKGYEKAIELHPAYADAHNNLGVLAQKVGRLEESLEHYDRALALRPAYTEAHCNRGNVLKELGRMGEALAAYDTVLRLQPSHTGASNNRGNVLHQQGRQAEALQAYQQALQFDASHADALLNRGNLYKDQGRVDEARQDLRAAIRLKPGSVQAHWALTMSYLPPFHPTAAAAENAHREYGASLDELVKTVHADVRGLACWEEAVGANQPFYLPYHCRNDRDLQRRYGELTCTIMSAWLKAQSLPAPRPRQDSRMRVGFVSAYMHRHSVWDVILRGLLKHLDRTRFSLACYNTGWRRDRETAQAEGLVDRFVRGPRTLPQWVQEIAADAPDVLVYPEIGMDPMTVKLASLRLAPVQMTAWGHPFTSGLPSMDYFLSGELLEPPEAADHYTEQLKRLPNLGCYFEPLGIEADDVELSELGIPEQAGVPRLVSCQQVSKYHPAHDELYVRIARALGRCRMVFVQVGRTQEACLLFRQRLEQAFRAAELNPGDYLSFLPTLSRRKFLGVLKKMDVYLDTPAFSGFTTAIQALACGGLPVVTLDGEFLRNRLAAAILRRIEVTETIAANLDEYVALVARLTREPEWRAELRGKILERLPGAYEDKSVIQFLEEFLTQCAARVQQ